MHTRMYNLRNTQKGETTCIHQNITEYASSGRRSKSSCDDKLTPLWLQLILILSESYTESNATVFELSESRKKSYGLTVGE